MPHFCRLQVPTSLEFVPLRDQREYKQNGVLNSTRDQEARKPAQSRVDAGDGVGANTDDSYDSDDADGGLVLVRKGERRGDDVEGDNSLDMLPLPLPRKKAKKLRITSDGVAALGETRKKVFDDDGPEAVSVLHE